MTQHYVIQETEAEQENKKSAEIIKDTMASDEEYILTKISDNEFSFGRKGDIFSHYFFEDNILSQLSEKHAGELSRTELLALAVLKNFNTKKG